jgi:hypothetical protein
LVELTEGWPVRFAQVQATMEAWEALKGKPLKKKLKSRFSGDFEKTIVGCLYHPDVLRAKKIRNAFSGE